MANFKTLEVAGWKPALYGMRMPFKSYNRADSYYKDDKFIMGPNDYDLAKRLWKAGTEHRKYLRMIQVWADIWAPRYWWAEWDTYRIGVSANSESTMHKILQEDFNEDNFEWPEFDDADWDIEAAFKDYIDILRTVKNRAQNESDNKIYYLKLLKGLLPESFIQKRTVYLNYETLATMYRQRKNHRLPQWSEDFVNWVYSLPYPELITGDFYE